MTVLLFGGAFPRFVAAQHAYINISDPFLRKSPVAVPDYRSLKNCLPNFTNEFSSPAS